MKTKHPCYPRKRFASQQSAGAAVIRIANTQKIQRYAVQCSKCNGWHLS